MCDDMKSVWMVQIKARAGTQRRKGEREGFIDNYFSLLFNCERASVPQDLIPNDQ
jgi:hypothetical protein